MKLEIKENSENYTCSIVQINKILPISGADNIARVVIFGNDVVTSINTKVNDIMLYFCAGTTINSDYLKYNNLYDKAEYNNDITKRGFISFKQKRIKAIKLRSIISNGILMSLESLVPLVDSSVINQLKVGDEFTTINGVTLCGKYNPSVIHKINTNLLPKEKTDKLKNIIIPNQFRFHESTGHLNKNVQILESGQKIIITRKFHGSSCIVSNLLVKRNLTWKEKLAKFFKIPIIESEYGFIWSSGKPKSKTPKGLESPTSNWKTKNQSYYPSDIWYKAYTELKNSCEKGISIYSELIGEGIQGNDYTYNEKFKILVYKITYTNIDGNVYEFNWDQVKSYCDKYGLAYVTEFFSGTLLDLKAHLNVSKRGLWNKECYLEYLAIKYLNKSFPDCNIDEGVVLRFEPSNEVLKFKSPNFTKLESDLQEQDIISIEDVE